MAELVDYVRHLSDEIGPRPATTDGEHHAAEWLMTTFGSWGLQSEMHEFDTPRTLSWSLVICNALTIAAAVLAGLSAITAKPLFTWLVVALATVSALLFWAEIDLRGGLSRVMLKGPSQNVIARHVPKARRGERLRRIVLVAHYDSARASLAASPQLSGIYAKTVTATKAATLLVPAVLLVMAMPIADKFDRWPWYAAIALGAVLLGPLLVNLHRQLLGPFTSGANGNASGVAVMLGAMERLIPAPDADSLSTTGTFPQIRRGPAAARAAGLVDPDSILQYTTAETPTGEPELPEDFEWQQAPVTPRKDQGILDFDDIEDELVEPRPAARRSSGASEEGPRRPVGSREVDLDDFEVPGSDEPGPNRGPKASGDAGRRSLFGRKREGGQSERELTNWLGVGDDFDARKAGANIGSWDNFGTDEDDEDGLGWKGGWAGDDPIGDPEFAASEAARIRRRVTETIDREVSEREIWFVATGAGEAGNTGMQALIRDFSEELKDALIINLDSLGSGQLHWLSAEGMGRRRRASQRLVGLARRVSRETETVIKPRVLAGVSTDATPALARGLKAITLMALGPSGMPANWHQMSDAPETIDPELLARAADFVAAMVREA